MILMIRRTNGLLAVNLIYLTRIVRANIFNNVNRRKYRDIELPFVIRNGS